MRADARTCGHVSACVWACARVCARARQRSQGSVAGDENGLDASTTNITSACRSLVPLLDTCIAMSAPWPGSTWPAATRSVSCAPRMLCSPSSTKNASEPGWLWTGVTAPGGPLASLMRCRYCAAWTRGMPA